MDFFKYFFLLCLALTVVMALPSNDAAKKLKKNKDNVRKPGLVRQKRQFGGGFGGYPGGGFSNSFANAGASSFGFPGFGGSSAFANAGAGAGGFGRKK